MRRSAAVFAILLASTSASGMSIHPTAGLMSGDTQAKTPYRPPTPGMANRILIKKAERRLYLMRDDAIMRSYPIALGFKPLGHKREEGDGRTPEGRYRLDWRNDRSAYYKALHIAYPNSRDRRRARAEGRRPGGMIMIHGEPRGRSAAPAIEGDWTLGCIAVSNPAMDVIWRSTANGIPVEILP